ncbi:helix-turn-helix domain-containing protein [Paraburkholderia sacchari]|uniref:helix-turn-helix domain-containing protein n=1 Tax=Paraburkholderia sacchari TaxID=159450 RepID=UPI001FD466E2|nr:LysR family transcriptional regulator [Paraburkholderia sacchari]
MHLSQTAVTKAVRELEQDPDAPLIVRGSRDKQLTEAAINSRRERRSSRSTRADAPRHRADPRRQAWAWSPMRGRRRLPLHLALPPLQFMGKQEFP